MCQRGLIGSQRITHKGRGGCASNSLRLQIVDASLAAVSSAKAWEPPPGSPLQQHALRTFQGAEARQSAPLLLLRGLARHCARSDSSAERVHILAAAADAAGEVPQAFGVSAIAACEGDLVRLTMSWFWACHIASAAPWYDASHS